MISNINRPKWICYQSK